MARIRTLKPEHTLNHKVGYLSDRAYRVWVALILNADDEGRGPLHVDDVRAKVYAFQPKVTIAHVERALLEIAEAKLAYFYSIDGKSYYEMHDWDEHQKIQHASVSKIPPCPQDLQNKACKNGTKEAILEHSGTFMNPHEDSLLIKDQGSRIKDHIYTVPDKTQEPSVAQKKVHAKGKDGPPGFQRFLAAHPHGGRYKGEAWKVWKKLDLEPWAEEICQALEDQKTWPDLAKEGFQFFIRPPRYLREQHWKDERPPARASPPAPDPCPECRNKDPVHREQHIFSFTTEDLMREHLFATLPGDQAHGRYEALKQPYRDKQKFREHERQRAARLGH